MQSFCDSSLEEVLLKTVEAVHSVKQAIVLLDHLSSKPGNYEPCAADLPAWASTVDSIATSVVDDATTTINPRSWEDRRDLHELVAKGIVAGLGGSTYEKG